MKLKFKQQDFQTDAVNAVCALFDGQQRQASTFSMERSGGQMALFADIGVSNALFLDDGRIMENMRAVQRKNLLCRRRFSLSLFPFQWKTAAPVNRPSGAKGFSAAPHAYSP